eukprot:CAMPEP_0113694900 /NCGR_PEP_ID=MMETSP0038_2-20120614/20574_1 /TAXON_ID=2898 /ORGANISM="Cryptomonas paramecium" /LENGTH=49 /DNA_ID=CAMNT_0000617329 /DNA_START=575 /DNA_END=720 /DNA_ORIENTATION=+ /assembly_acc=CAM_ASM_000170
MALVPPAHTILLAANRRLDGLDSVNLTAHAFSASLARSTLAIQNLSVGV